MKVYPSKKPRWDQNASSHLLVRFHKIAQQRFLVTQTEKNPKDDSTEKKTLLLCFHMQCPQSQKAQHPSALCATGSFPCERHDEEQNSSTPGLRGFVGPKPSISTSFSSLQNLFFDNHRIAQVGKDLKDHQAQPQPNHTTLILTTLC